MRARVEKLTNRKEIPPILVDAEQQCRIDAFSVALADRLSHVDYSVTEQDVSERSFSVEAAKQALDGEKLYEEHEHSFALSGDNHECLIHGCHETEPHDYYIVKTVDDDIVWGCDVCSLMQGRPASWTPSRVNLAKMQDARRGDELGIPWLDRHQSFVTDEPYRPAIPMECPQCGDTTTATVIHGTLRGRRECVHCNHEWWPSKCRDCGCELLFMDVDEDNGMYWKCKNRDCDYKDYDDIGFWIDWRETMEERLNEENPVDFFDIVTRSEKAALRERLPDEYLPHELRE